MSINKVHLYVFSMLILGHLGLETAFSGEKAPLVYLPKPFWKTEKAYLTRLDEKREILVSASVPKIKSKKEEFYNLKVKAAGYIRAPINFIFSTIQDFEKLPKVNEKFKEVKYDNKKNELYVHIAVMDFHAKMTLKLDRLENEGVRQINWKVIKGSFLGMDGVVRLEKLERRKTEMFLIADHKSKTIPLPKVLMGLGLEVVAQKVAHSMRAYVEKQFHGG